MTEKTEAPPLTDEELDDIDRHLSRDPETTVDHRWALRLVAEVRRLRAPLADKELQAIIDTAHAIYIRAVDADIPVEGKIGAAERADGPEVVGVPADVAKRLANELYRLRSDEWLDKAAEQIAYESDGLMKRDVLAILHKYRDGGA